MTPQIIPSIFTIVDNMTIPIKKIGMALRNLGTQSTLEAAKMRMAFSATSATAMNIANQSATIAAGILIPLGLATKAAVDFEKSLGDIETLIDTNKESLEGIGDGLLKMSRKIPKPISDLTQGMYQIRSAGIETGDGINQAFGVLENSGKLAVAGLATTTEAVNTMTSAMNVFKSEGLSSEQIANSFFKTVQGGKTTMSQLNASFGNNAGVIHEAGVRLEEFNAMTAALTLTGATASAAQTQIASGVTALIKPSKNLQDVYESLGYSGTEAFKQIIKDSGGLVPAFEKVNNQAEKLGVSMGEDFGNKRAMLGVMQLVGSQANSYKELLKIQNDVTHNALDEKFNSQSAKAAARMEIFKNSVNRLGIAVGNTLIPALDKLIAVIEPIINGIGEFAHNHKTLAKIIFGSIGTFGLLAAGVAGVSFVVGTVTKAFWLWRGAMIAFNTIQAATIAIGRGLSAWLLSFPTIANGYTAATTRMAGATGVFNTSLMATLGWLTAIGAGLVYVNQQMNLWTDVKKDKRNRDMNFFSQKRTPEEIKQYREDNDISDAEYEENKKHAIKVPELMKGEKTIYKQTDDYKNYYNGGREKLEVDRNILNNQVQDSTQKTSFIDTKQSKIIVEINDKTSDKFGVSLGNISGSAAQAVKLKIVTT